MTNTSITSEPRVQFPDPQQTGRLLRSLYRAAIRQTEFAISQRWDHLDAEIASYMAPYYQIRDLLFALDAEGLIQLKFLPTDFKEYLDKTEDDVLEAICGWTKCDLDEVYTKSLNLKKAYKQ